MARDRFGFLERHGFVKLSSGRITEITVDELAMLIARDVVINAVGIAGPSSSYHGGGNSRMPATAGTISARMIRIQRMTAVCGGIGLISPAK